MRDSLVVDAQDIPDIIEHFSRLEDPRSEINRQHPLVSVIVTSLMAVLANADGPTAIARWASLKADFLSEHLNFPNGIPGKDCFRRVLSALNPTAFQDCFSAWLNSLRAQAAEKAGVTQPILSVDGKSLRRSHDHNSGLGVLHSVSVWCSEFGLSLGQVACEEKSNEITAIPPVLKRVDLKGAIVTIDAMGTQTAIAEQIVDGEGDYVLVLKDNQKTLYRATVDDMNEQMETDFTKVVCRRHQTQETGHGREEIRTDIQMPVPKDLRGADRWKGLRTIGIVLLTCLRNGKETTECRYYISSLRLGVKQFAHAVRSHWGIENGCHRRLDMTYREDESRIRNANLRENFAWLRRITLSLLKQSQGKESVAMRRRACAWDDNVMLQVITGSGA